MYQINILYLKSTQYIAIKNKMESMKIYIIFKHAHLQKLTVPHIFRVAIIQNTFSDHNVITWKIVAGILIFLSVLGIELNPISSHLFLGDLALSYRMWAEVIHVLSGLDTEYPVQSSTFLLPLHPKHGAAC